MPLGETAALPTVDWAVPAVGFPNEMANKHKHLHLRN